MSLLEHIHKVAVGALAPVAVTKVAAVADEKMARATDFSLSNQGGSTGSTGSSKKHPSPNAVANVAPTPPPLTAIEQHAITEAVAERAAIMEFDGKLPRVIAESEASSQMRVYQALIAMPDGSAPRWLVYLAPGSTLAEAHQDLVSKFGAERVLEVVEPNSRNGGLKIDEVAA